MRKNLYSVPALMRFLLFFIGAAVGLLFPTGSAGAETSNPGDVTTNRPTFWLIPHTHWEGAVFKTREEYLESGLPNILTAVRLLKENPNYRFALDQVAYFKPFLERYSEEAAAFRKFVAEGRLQIVGGMDVMPDVNMPGGESFVRQMLYAKGYCRRELGVDVKVGWLLDTFGHHAQMPQLLKLAGYDSFWFTRGMTRRDRMPSEFLWQGVDGTRIPAFWLPCGYGLLYGSPPDIAGFTVFVTQQFEALAPFARGGDCVGLAGGDVSEPEPHVADLVEQFNQQTNLPFTLRIGVPTDFEAEVARRAGLPVITGELNPLFQGVYSSRIELKQWMRNCERLLITAEKFDALAGWLGASREESALSRAWEPVLFNAAHDLASGVMTERVYADTVRSFEYSERLGEELVETRLDQILSRIDTQGDGVPLVVFNPLGWPRTDVSEADIGFAQGGIMDFDVTDAAGKIIPSQILETERYADGGFKRIKFAFIARDVPAVGHSIYHVVSRKTAGESKVGVLNANGSGALENEFYRADFDLASGALTSLLVKAIGWQALSGPGNVVARETDDGDFWELNQSLDASQRLIMTRPLGVPKPGQARFSNKESGRMGMARHGPVFSEFVRRPFGTNSFGTTARLYDGIARLDFATRTRNQEKYVRHRLLFPTAIQRGSNVQEIPFGAIERPTAQEFPAQNWMDYGDGTRGVALLNRGLPGNNVADGTLMLSLMRATRLQARSSSVSYERPSNDSGFALGQERTFHYALMPHPGDWRDAGVVRAGLEFNHPLIVRKATPHAGILPGRWGLLEISKPNVVLSALKPGQDGSIILRVYETSGEATRDVQIKLHASIISAHTASLMEDDLAEMSREQDTLRFDLHAFEIRTFKLRIKTLPSGR